MSDRAFTRWRTILPQPLVSGVLLLVWLLAQNAISPGLLLTGAVLAVAIPLFTRQFWPEYPGTVRFAPLARLIMVVLFDMFIANVRVARLILGSKSRLRPAFFTLPVTLRGEFPLSLLASVISLTPGTVSADLTPDRRTLLVHGLDVDDAGAAVRHIKARYERLLMEAFE